MSAHAQLPSKYRGKGDVYLPKIARDLERKLENTSAHFKHRTLRLSRSALSDFSESLVEFAEDLHNGIGLWRSLENYNRDFFGTPLPLAVDPGSISERSPETDGITPQRLSHFLWVILSKMLPDLYISPAHSDMNRWADESCLFLKKRFADIPADSGVKNYLGSPNPDRDTVKQKLVWVGKHSYLFRLCFRDYVQESGGKHPSVDIIDIVDDFICQATTCWSGLGPIDILARTLDLSDGERLDLRSWYERHQAFYRLESKDGSRFKSRNLINNATYVINMGRHEELFKVGEVIFGALAPWNGEWHWSGTQKNFGFLSEKAIENARKTMVQSSPGIVYRYCKDLAEKARQVTEKYRQNFLEYHGSDLVVYPDGYAMAADTQKRHHRLYAAQPEEVVSEVMRKHKIPHPWPRLDYPKDLLECSEGVAVFFNPDEGEEFFLFFNDLVSGFKKRGNDLADGEGQELRGFVTSDAISPGFVHRLVKEYGAESILAAFLIPPGHESVALEYLLRSYKGHFYRKRYPALAFALDD